MKRIVAILLLCLTGCVTPEKPVAHAEFWNPTDAELALLEFEIQKYIYIHLSDQSPSFQDIPEVEVKTVETNGELTIVIGPVPSFDPPAELTIQQIPFQSYRREYLGKMGNTGKYLMIAFFDSKRYPKKNERLSPWMLGGFPHFFTLTINMETKKVIKHYASRI